METRSVQQARIYFLILNTFGRAEEGRIVAAAGSEDALKIWYESQRMEQSENIDGWHYTFKKESLIRHYNPLGNWANCNQDPFGHGWFDKWVVLSDGPLRDDIFRIDF